jgi:biotin transport system substrate-specific component
MLNKYLQFHSNDSYDFVIKLVLSLLLVCFLGPVVIKVRESVPITLQTFTLLFVAINFGWRIGTVASLLYVLFGLAGLPVFAGYVGGIENLNGAFGGFLFGFIVGSVLTGFLAEAEKAERPLQNFGIWVLGHAVILAMGAFWLRSLNPDGWQEMAVAAIPGAMVKSALGFLFSQVVLRLAKGRKGYYDKH